MSVLDTFQLSGRVAVVTGGNRGLGKAFAFALGEAGARGGDPGPGRGRHGAGGGGTSRIAAYPRRVFRPMSCAAPEVDRAVEVDRRHEWQAASTSSLNNAGACIHRPALEVTADEWQEVVDVNLNGVWNCCQAFGRLMADSGGGSIVNVGSMSGQIVNRPQWQPAYNATKAAVHHLTRSLAAEWAPLQHPGERARAWLREDRHVAGGRAAVPPALDRGRADAAVRHAGGDRAQRGLPRQRRVGLHDGNGAGDRRWLHGLLTALGFEGLLEPVVGVGLVVEGGHFAVAGAAVEPDRFGQRAVGLKPESVHQRRCGPCLEFGEKPSAQPRPPHAG